MRESTFQRIVIREIRDLFPNCIILKNDPDYLQGIGDYAILWKNKWALLEFKKAEDSEVEPNQEYYVGLAHKWSFGSFIYPENKERVLYELQQAFRTAR